VASRVDDSGATIGKRYSRNDELGTPFGITIDFASIKNNTVTIRCAGSCFRVCYWKASKPFGSEIFCRERDTTKQLIGTVDEVIQLVSDLCTGKLTWQDATQKLPEYSGQQDD